MNKTITIDGQNYQIDLDRAIQDGYLVKEKKYPATNGEQVEIVSRSFHSHIVTVARIGPQVFILLEVNDNFNRFSDTRLVTEGATITPKEWDTYMTQIGVIEWKLLD